LQCWICGKYNHKKDFPLYQGGSPQIYSTQEVQTIRDVGHSIPRIYVVADNMQVYHQTFIIEMDSKIFDQVISILIDLGSSYSYVSPNLVD